MICVKGSIKYFANIWPGVILLSTVIYIYWSSKLQTLNVDLIHVMGIQNEENPSGGCEEKAGSITCDSISISILCNSYVLPTWHCPKANANEGLTFQLFSRGCSRCVHICGLISSHLWQDHRLSEVLSLFFFASRCTFWTAAYTSLIFKNEQSEDSLQPCASFQFSNKPEDCPVAGIIARDGFFGLYRGFVPNVLKNLPNSRYDVFLHFARGIFPLSRTRSFLSTIVE